MRARPNQLTSPYARTRIGSVTTALYSIVQGTLSVLVSDGDSEEAQEQVSGEAFVKQHALI